MHNEPCQRIDHPNGIYELHFQQATRAGVDAMLQHLVDIATIARNTPEEDYETVRVLITNPRHAVPPVRYLFKEMRRIMPQIQNERTVRVAVMYEGGIFGDLSRLFVGGLRYRTLAFKLFSLEERTEAIAWLLSA